MIIDEKYTIICEKYTIIREKYEKYTIIFLKVYYPWWLLLGVRYRIFERSVYQFKDRILSFMIVCFTWDPIFGIWKIIFHNFEKIWQNVSLFGVSVFDNRLYIRNQQTICNRLICMSGTSSRQSQKFFEKLNLRKIFFKVREG